MTNMAVHVRHRISLISSSHPSCHLKSEPRPQSSPHQYLQGMHPSACPSPDDLFRNVRDLTASTKIIGTKPFAYGGYSDIWRGVEWGAGATRNVAIKIIRVATRQSVSLERLKKRISREVVTWSAVAHQNILPFYGLYWPNEPDSLPAMVYPYCEAGTCSDYLTNNPDADRMSILRQVADGLNHLHSFKPPIAHGDLKAANILMTRDGIPLIADFGLSRLVMEFSTGLTTSSSKGSYRWMAPELFGGIDNHVLVFVTTASDVWAFGCLCLEILLGVIPWASTRSDAAIMMAVVKDRRSPPLPESTGISAIGHIMRHCWIHEPTHRPSIGQLINALIELDPEHLHASACALLPPTVFSDSPPAILNSDSDSFTRTFSDSPLISSGTQTVTRSKTPTAPVLEPLFPPQERVLSQRRVTPTSSSGVTPYLDMVSLTPSDSGSSGTTSRDEPSLFEIQPPLFGPGPQRPSKFIRGTRQSSQPFWPRTPSNSYSTLPQPSRPSGDDVFRSEAWRRSDVSTPSSTRSPTRPPSQSSLHIWTPPRADSRHGWQLTSMSPISQYSSDRSTTTTSHPTPVTPVGTLPPQYPRHVHSHSTTCVPQASPDNTSSGNYYVAPPLPTRSSWSPGGAVPRDFQIATSKPIRITTPDGKPVTLPERKSSSSSSPIKPGRL